MTSNKQNINIVRVKDFEMRIYPYKEYISEQLRSGGSYEKDYIEVIQTYIKPGNTVLDIGANIGLHTLHFSRAVGPLGKVIAFEPDPSNLELLRFNVKRNKCNNVVIHPYALGAHSQSRKLYLCQRNKGKQSFADLDELNDPITVNVRKALDFSGFEHAAVVKMDVEGAEPMVFEGFGKFRPPMIFFEFTTKQLLALNHDPLQFLNQLESVGYRLSVIEGKNIISVKPEEFTALASSTNRDYNLLAEL